MDKSMIHNLITSNIKNEGYHLTIVNNNLLPRYAYTIGLTEKLGFELIFAGGMIYYYKEIVSIIYQLKEKLIKKEIGRNQFEIDSGIFSLVKTHESWNKLMTMGIFDYFNKSEITIFQILPDTPNLTLDIPNMASDYNVEKSPIWRYLTCKWDYDVPEDSQIITNKNTLFGEKIKEITRWELNEWEGFSENGDTITEENIRVLPLSILLSIDNSLVDALNLDIGKGLWRDESNSWNKWGLE